MNLYQDIKEGNAKIAVYGLGNVGSVIASVWLRKGAHVIGIDKSKEVVDKANDGLKGSREPGVSEALVKAIEEGRFMATTDPYKAREARIIFVAVPLLIKDGNIDYSSIEEVSDVIGRIIKKGSIVCINTSLPPNTTESRLLPRLTRYNNLKPDVDFFLIYSPERIYLGRAIKDMEENYPAIVSGIGENSKKIGEELYSIIAKKGVIVMSSIRAAELEKLVEGVYRDVNIALANELSILCSKLGIDFWEVREAANSQPYCNIHRAGIGVGGICIPIYPQFVLNSAASVKVECNMINKARVVNESMPTYSVMEAIRLLNGKKNVTILGLAYRGNVSDARLSPVYKVIEEFLKHGLKVKLHDPYVDESSVPKGVEFTRDLIYALKGSDLVFIATDHEDYKMLEEDLIIRYTNNAVVYDGRGVIDRKFKKVKVYGIGRINEDMV